MDQPTPLEDLILIATANRLEPGYVPAYDRLKVVLAERDTLKAQLDDALIPEKNEEWLTLARDHAAMRASLDDADAHIEKLDAIIQDWASGAKVKALEEDAKLCRGMVSAQEAMIQNALEPLGCGYPFDHHAAEWAADTIGGLKEELALRSECRPFAEGLMALAQTQLRAENAALEVKLEEADLAFNSQTVELENAVAVLEEVHPDCVMEYRYRTYPGLHNRPDGFVMPSIAALDLSDHDKAVRRDALEQAIERVMDCDCVGLLEGSEQLTIQEAIFAGIPPSTDKPTQEPK